MDFTKRKIEITKKVEKRLCITEHDPRPSIQVDNQSLLDNLKISLLQSNNGESLKLVERERIEQDTREQVQSQLWYLVRARN